MPDPAEVTKEMVEAGAAEFRRITKGDGVLTPQETRMDIHEMATHHILTAARQHDPLVAEVVRLREENERLREEVERLRQSAPQALSALENYGQHHSWCDKRMAPNCPCGFNATVVGLQVMVFAERIGAEVSDSLSDSDGTQQ